MKSSVVSTFLIALTLVIAPAAALAGDALPQLKGKWEVTSVDGEALPAGFMTMDFVDDKKVLMSVFGEEPAPVAYSATKEGEITIEEDKGKWEVKDGKLHIKMKIDGKDNVMICKRKS